MTFDFEDPGKLSGHEFLKDFNLFRLSYALTSVFIIKFRFPVTVNADISRCAHDIKVLFKFIIN